MKFEVGDTVQIRHDLKTRPPLAYDHPGIISCMLKYRGKKAEILSKKTERHGKFGYYKLNIDDKIYNWTDDMVNNPSRITIN